MITVRQANSADITQIHRIRLAVHENKLTHTIVESADYVPAIEQNGRGWVAEENKQIVGFAIVLTENSYVWALFVDPEHESRGIGRQLLAAAVSWLEDNTTGNIWLTTELGTRAADFYKRQGWLHKGYSNDGEIVYQWPRSKHISERN